MNNTEFEAVRRLLFLSRKELAAALQVREFSVNRWQTGKHPVPQGVADAMRELMDYRKRALAEVERAVAQNTQNETCLIWYDGFNDWLGDDEAAWRAHQSMCAEAYANYGVRLVVFNPESYFTWLQEKGYKDSPQFRAQWAASSLN